MLLLSKLHVTLHSFLIVHKGAKKGGGGVKGPHARMRKEDTASLSLNPTIMCGDQMQSPGRLIKASQVFNSQQEKIYSSQRDDFCDPDQ